MDRRSRWVPWVLPGVLPLVLAAAVAGQKADGKKGDASAETPVTGAALPGLEGIDRVVLETLRQRHIPGAAVAVSKDGRLVLARGYGLADVEAGTPVRPAVTLFNLASVTKAVTAVSVLKLVDEGKLRLDDRLVVIMKRLKPAPGDTMDPRFNDITVRHLLLHAGGWDRHKSPEAHGRVKQVARHLGIKPPLTDDQLYVYMLGRPLDFAPGTDAVYSNFGYQTLKHVVAEVTGQDYEAWVRKNVLAPMGITDMCVDAHDGYVQNEAKRYPAGGTRPNPADKDNLEGPGCWKATAVDMVRFLTAVDGSRGEPFLSKASMKEMLAAPKGLKSGPRGGHFGLGWDTVLQTDEGISYHKDGGISGISTYIEHLPNGVDFAVLFNGSPARHDEGRKARGESGPPWAAVKGEIEKTAKWPRGNLWRQFR